MRCEDFNGDRASCLTVEAATCIYDDASMTCIDLFGLTSQLSLFDPPPPSPCTPASNLSLPIPTAGTPDTDYCGILTVEQCREVFTLCTYSIPPGQLSGTVRAAATQAPPPSPSLPPTILHLHPPLQCRALECTDANEPGSCSTATCTIYGSIANNDFLCLPSGWCRALVWFCVVSLLF